MNTVCDKSVTVHKSAVELGYNVMKGTEYYVSL
jgi:hypothetical protein